MREFDKPIGKAWRRMRLQRFVSALVWCWGAGLLAVAAAIAVEKLTDREIPGAAWLPFAIAGGVGLVVAGLIAIFTGPSRVDAAVAIDRLFGLNDRLATTLTLPAELRDTPAGRALIADTVRHVSGLHIGEKFGLKPPKLAWLPLLPAALAVGLLFIPEWVSSQAGTKSKAERLVEKEQEVKALKTISKQIAEHAKEAQKSELSAETKKLLAEIEKAASELSKAPPTDKEKALVELNKMTDKLKDQQKKMGGAEQIAKQLQQMKEMASNGPADDFAKELAKGDFQKAAEQVKKLAEKMKDGKLNEADKKALKEQLNEMKQQLEKMANMEERKKQLEKALASGAMSKEQFDKQMDKLEQQSKDLKKLAQLASKLDKAAEALANGDTKKAADALGMSQQQLEQMAKQAQELESLDQALADLQDAKNGMANDGMNQLGKGLDGVPQPGMGNRPGNGNGMGRGRGQGDRPEAQDNVASYNSKTKAAEMLKGKAVMEGFAKPGKQTKGESLMEIQGNVDASAREQSEALSTQKIPNSVKKHVSGYFDKVRQGQ